MDRALALSDRLRSHGVDSWIDQYETSPAEGWPRWCARQVREADFVLVICTETYERRFRGIENGGRGLGSVWEGYLVTQELHDASARNTKFVPVVFPGAVSEHIPDLLRGVTRYEVGGDGGYWQLYRRLSGQAETPAPPLGARVPLPARERRAERFTLIPDPRYENEQMRALAENLEKAYRRLEEQTVAGGETSTVREEILRLRREIRDSGRLQAGDFLAEGRFKLLEPLGRGGFAIVWKAYDRQRHELVAVKVLHGLHAEDRTRRERFFRGARKMAELHHHGIVRVLESHLEDAGNHFFVMEHVDGGDLRQAVLEGHLRRGEILPLILAVGRALSFAHDQGVIHRDVKPANVLLNGHVPKLTDFDLVRAFDTTGGTQTQGLLGTFLYTAPEVLSNAKDAGIAADVYSLAMTAVFGYYGRDLPADVWRRPEIFLERISCPPGVREALCHGIAWEPEERPNSVTELCRKLRDGFSGDRPGRKKRARQPQPGEERVNEKDGSILVYVPGGVYALGAIDISPAEKPVHRVLLSPFWMARHPVTHEQYGRFLKENPEARQPAHWTDRRYNQLRQPVVGVSWEEAKAYCAWAGLQLPTEAQWEAAARGRDRRRYPWGNTEPSPEHANFNTREGRTMPVGAYPDGAGPFGTLDQAGNVWEWCEDVWNPVAYRERDGVLNPVSASGDPLFRALRGGSWLGSTSLLEPAYRSWARTSTRIGYIGFRCCLPAS